MEVVLSEVEEFPMVCVYDCNEGMIIRWMNAWVSGFVRNHLYRRGDFYGMAWHIEQTSRRSDGGDG